MKSRFRMFQRQGGVFYWQDNETRQQGSLGTKDKHAAKKLLHAKNESHEQPILNLAQARAYATAHDPKMSTRTWHDVMTEMASDGRESTQERCKRAMNSRSLDLIRDKTLLPTTSDDLLTVMPAGGNSTNHYLRRLHNLAVNHREASCACLRIELPDGSQHLLSYSHFLAATLTRTADGLETIRLSFSGHDVEVEGQGLREVLLGLQDFGIKWIRTAPARYQPIASPPTGFISAIRIVAVE